MEKRSIQQTHSVSGRDLDRTLRASWQKSRLMTGIMMMMMMMMMMTMMMMVMINDVAASNMRKFLYVVESDPLPTVLPAGPATRW